MLIDRLTPSLAGSRCQELLGYQGQARGDPEELDLPRSKSGLASAPPDGKALLGGRVRSLSDLLAA